MVPGFVQDILYLTAVLNSCLNPLIYGLFYYSERKSETDIVLTRYKSQSYNGSRRRTTLLAVETDSV